MTEALHVLLVEDNDAHIDLTRAMLEATTFDIKLTVVRDGVEAINFLNGLEDWSEHGQPMLIVLDLNLPRKDGRQVLAVLKSEDRFRRIPVVVMSSSDSEKDITACYHVGANCYLVKPADMSAFRAMVQTLEKFWLGAAALPRRQGHSDATRIGYGH